MAQTLAALPALTSPVTLAQSKTFVGDMAAINNVGTAGIKTIGILGKIYKLAAAGGTNYKTNHPQLIQDAASLFGGVQMLTDLGLSENVYLAQAVQDWSNGRAADATLSADVPTLLKEGRDFLALPVETLNRLRLLLNYKIA